MNLGQLVPATWAQEEAAQRAAPRRQRVYPPMPAPRTITRDDPAAHYGPARNNLTGPAWRGKGRLQQAVLDHLAEHPWSKLQAIASGIEASVENVRTAVNTLRTRGEVVRKGPRGAYVHALAPHSTHTKASAAR